MSEPDKLLKIFSGRPNRYGLLDSGFKKWMTCNGTAGAESFLEVGCAYGDGSAHIATTYNVEVVGFDCCEPLIRKAIKRHGTKADEKLLRFRHGKAEDIPYPDSYFTGIVMEASFSPLLCKHEAAHEFYRVLKSKGRLLLNDFAINTSAHKKNYRAAIPCLYGVESMDIYDKILHGAGFSTLHMSEEFTELVNIIFWLASNINISQGDSDSIRISHILKDLPVDTKLTYCQMVFEKG